MISVSVNCEEKSKTIGMITTKDEFLNALDSVKEFAISELKEDDD
jgi:hypothetical protein